MAALWFPDWPVQAARLEKDLPAAVAVIDGHRVRACSATARRTGVRRGMRVREARSLCPDLAVLDDDPDRDGRAFGPLAAGLDDVAASVEVLRPGLVVVDAGAAGRFHGSEDRAVELLVDAAARRGVDALAGVADELATALLAARVGAVVPAGGSREFLAPQPVGLLAAEVALGCEASVVEALTRLGVDTLGRLAALPVAAVHTRFGAAGRRCHRIATAAPDRRVSPALPERELTVVYTPEEPIERVDAAAFAARALAARLHARLAGSGLSCLRLRVLAELADGTRLERVWRTREALTEQATADRVRWQLDGWLTAGGAGALATLILEPVEVTAPDHAGRLFGDGPDGGRRRRAVSRVQSVLGVGAVLQPRLLGGRGVAERIGYVPYGEECEPAGRGAWPGRIPAPLPARLGGGPDHPTARVRLLDETGREVIVTAEALLSSRPHVLGWGRTLFRVSAWAGPWPVDVGWWGRGKQKVARLQLVGQADDEEFPRAWLLLWSARRWRVEATYG